MQLGVSSSLQDLQDRQGEHPELVSSLLITPERKKESLGPPGTRVLLPEQSRVCLADLEVVFPGWEVLMLILEREMNKAELFWHVAPGKERKSLKRVFFKREGMKSMGKRVIAPSSGEHVPDGGEENPFPPRSVAGHSSAEGS
ncbi:hypothetical protein DUI87_26655 [Hirundo rustica rustica]|uniref:Uncharacterized protein n=1 Tax=Hirundo rustica rustica TaxID=333673 RepID=A0A3M0J8K5_HIRRU|nr:hypothetical protein DUI87_26655 [Hirundo rustica rustica]